MAKIENSNLLTVVEQRNSQAQAQAQDVVFKEDLVPDVEMDATVSDFEEEQPEKYRGYLPTRGKIKARVFAIAKEDIQSLLRMFTCCCQEREKR